MVITYTLGGGYVACNVTTLGYLFIVHNIVIYGDVNCGASCTLDRELQFFGNGGWWWEGER